MDKTEGLTNWQRAVNTIAHALNKAGYDGDSPESKALELLAGRCEGTADAKEIAHEIVGIMVSHLRSFNDPQTIIENTNEAWTRATRWLADDIADRIAPLLKPSVDVGELAGEIRKAESNWTDAATEADKQAVTGIIIRRQLTDSSAEIAALRSELDKVKGDKDGAYTERNRLVAFIASLFPSQQCKTDIEGWDPEWHGCVFIETPAGQLSWHFHDSDAELFDHVPYGSPIWDGHSTPEKYVRLRSLIDIRALSETGGEQEGSDGDK